MKVTNTKGKRKIEHLRMFMNSFPVLHSDYLNWVMRLSYCSDKERAKIEEFYHALLGVADPDWIPEFIIIEIDGKKMAFDSIKDYDLDDAIDKLKGLTHENLVDGEYYFTPHATLEDEIKANEGAIQENVKLLIKTAEALKNKDENETFYYHSIPVLDVTLFEYVTINGAVAKRIRSELLPYLRFMDLSKVDFCDADVRGLDLSYTNVKLVLESLYLRSLRGTNLKGVMLGFEVIRGVDFTGANLEETHAVLDAGSVLLDDAITDDTCVIFNSAGVFPKEGKEITVRQIIHL